MEVQASVGLEPFPSMRRCPAAPRGDLRALSDAIGFVATKHRENGWFAPGVFGPLLSAESLKFPQFNADNTFVRSNFLAQGGRIGPAVSFLGTGQAKVGGNSMRSLLVFIAASLGQVEEPDKQAVLEPPVPVAPRVVSVPVAGTPASASSSTRSATTRTVSFWQEPDASTSFIGAFHCEGGAWSGERRDCFLRRLI